MESDGCGGVMGLTMMKAEDPTVVDWSLGIFNNKTTSSQYERGASAYIEALPIADLIKFDVSCTIPYERK